MRIEISSVRTIGSGIVRPEGVMVLDDGTIITADGRGRCARIKRDGGTSFFGSLGGVPNGICIDARDHCIIANIGNGEVQSLAPDGRHEVLLTEAGGKRIIAPNFPVVDSQGRLWVSNSTCRVDIQDAIQNPAPDGCIVIVDSGGSRVVAEEIYFANGMALDEPEQHLYVAETTRKRIVRFKIAEDGSLHQRRIYGPEQLGPLGFPDGVAFDEAGNLWVTFPAWNTVGYIDPDENLNIVLEDPEKKLLRRPSNICFGWEDRRTAFIGSLEGTSIPFFQVPHPGLKLVHQR